MELGVKAATVTGQNFFTQFASKHGGVHAPDIIELEKLIQFFAKQEILNTQQLRFLKNIQQKRNAIHAFKSRDIGTFEEFYCALDEYFDLLCELKYRLPYP